MKKNKVFVLLLGKSGVGKTTIAEYMERNYGLKQVVSYTNRPQRFEGEVGHKFLTEQNVEKIKEKFPNMVAADTYDGHFYFATAEQVEECDVYVINPSAVEQFKASYHGDKLIKVVQIDDLPENIVKHMLQRGDSLDKIQRRQAFDAKEFAGSRKLCDLVLANTGIERTARALHAAIWGWNVIAETESED